MQPIISSRPNLFTGGTLDRAGHLREDDTWIATARDNPASRFVLFWRGQAKLPQAAADAAPNAPPDRQFPWVFLGLQNNLPVFAVDLSALDHPGDGFADLLAWHRSGAMLTHDDATILVTARAMLHWRRQHLFCHVCGSSNQPVRAGYVLRCQQCGTEHFPRTDPAVIMLVVKNDHVLLGQSHRFPPEQNFYSALAGFVEPGESLEDAVRREVFEETGVRVGEVHYHSSQPWPFPASLMLGFFAEGLSDGIVLEAAEMRDARWFSRAELASHESLGFALPPESSIARRLIDDWIEQAP